MILGSLKSPPQDKEKVAVIHAAYPGFDKAMYAKTKRPDHYGIRLVAEAEWLLREAFPEPESKKAENRKLKCRISFRTTKTLFTELERKLKADGFDTMQGGMTHIAKMWLAQRKEAAASR